MNDGSPDDDTLLTTASTRARGLHRHLQPTSPIALPEHSRGPRSLAASLTRRAIITGVASGATVGSVGLPGQLHNQTSARPKPKASPPRGTRTSSTFQAASQAPTEFSLPTALESVPLDPLAGFDLPIGPFRATFIPRAGLLGPTGDPERLLREPLIMAMVVTCLKDLWWIESEPAGDQTFTMVAYAAESAPGGSHRTAVLSGQGVVTAEGGHKVQFSLQTVPALTGSDRHDQLTATVVAQSDGSYEGQVAVTEVSAEKYGHGPCHKRCKDKSGEAQRQCNHRCHKRKKRRKHKKRH